MTAGADARSADRRVPISRAVGWATKALAAGIIVICAACTSATATVSSPTAGDSGAAADPGSAGGDGPGLSGPAAGAIPITDELAIRATIATLNAASAGPVAEQQTALRTVVDAAAVATLDNCPPATTTLLFEPVWTGLRPDPAIGDTPDGTGYALPTRIRAFTADRITATDLTTLQLTVRSGAAYLTPICAG